MTDFYGEERFYTDQNFRQEAHVFGEIERAEALKKCIRFIQEFMFRDQYTYRDQLRNNSQNQQYYLKIEIDDISNFDHNLYLYINSRPQDIQPLFEDAIKQVYSNYNSIPIDLVPDFQLQLVSQQNPILLRDLKSHLLGKLVTAQGIIISSAKISIKAQKLVIQCKQCNDREVLELGYGIQGVYIPRLCKRSLRDKGVQGREECPIDCYVIQKNKNQLFQVMIPEESLLIDQQILRMQELPESIATGEIPRNFMICCDRLLVNSMVPGQRVTVTGIYQVQMKGGDQQLKTKSHQSQLKIPYIHVLGFEPLNKVTKQTEVSEQQRAQFNALASSPDIHKIIAKSIAPAIYGHEDIKLALACLLFSGSTKYLPDGMKLRGDINVLLIGDPSTAKSQMLKFIERASEISVYTSGKGSSAAGLTASITHAANSSQFTLEAGALVLASGGVCCIDEFDKMRPEDRVAMHEAMEQQTISIAKAGITTRLNAKCSILAAANPIYGRYEESKTIQDQIELQTTILSRFDTIFIVKDVRTAESDQRMANHILNLHTGKFQEQEFMEEERNDMTWDMDTLRQYVKYAKSVVQPRLSEAAALLVENLYTQDREKCRQQGHHRQHGGKSHIPITVRQLEAIIRLSEALARMALKQEVQEHHVKEAHRLFQNSTMLAVSLGAKEFGLDLPSELRQLVGQIEESIKRRVAIGSRIPYNKLVEELVQRFNNLRAVQFAIDLMIRNEDLQQIEHRKMLFRKK